MHVLFSTLTEGFPCFFLSCKANARVYLAKTGHGSHSSLIVLFHVLIVLFYILFCVDCVVHVLFVCKCMLLPPGDNLIAIKYIISYNIVRIPIYVGGWRDWKLGFGSSKKRAVISLDHHLQFDFVATSYRSWRLKPANNSPAVIWHNDNKFSVVLSLPVSNTRQRPAILSNDLRCSCRYLN